MRGSEKQEASLNQSDKYAGDGCPQSHQEQRTSSNRDGPQNNRFQIGPELECDGSVMNQHDATGHPQQKQGHAWPSVGKHGKQALQSGESSVSARN